MKKFILMAMVGTMFCGVATGCQAKEEVKEDVKVEKHSVEEEETDNEEETGKEETDKEETEDTTDEETDTLEDSVEPLGDTTTDVSSAVPVEENSTSESNTAEESSTAEESHTSVADTLEDDSWQ